MTNYSIAGSSGTAGLSALTTPADDDLLLIVDVSDTSTAPAGSAGSDKKITFANLTAGLGGGGNTDLARVFGAGHSYMAGYQNTEPGERYLTRLCASLRAEEVCYAVSGAVLAEDESEGNLGGYPTVVNALTPRVFSGSAYTPRNSGPYFPVSPVVVFDYGVNDVFNLDPDITVTMGWVSMALTACCCIARAGGWFPDTDASVSYGSGWTANTSVQDYGWPTNHSAGGAGDYLTITVPADFPGGEISLLTLTFAGGTEWTAVVDSGSPQVLNGLSAAYGSSATGRANLVVQRLTGLAAGTHTIVLTATAVDSDAAPVFQGWLIAAPQPPAVVLANQPLAPSLSGDTTQLDALNTGIASVAASFTDGSVVVADAAAAFAGASANVDNGQPGSGYASDNLHPGPYGHMLFAQCIRDAIEAAPSPGVTRMAPAGVLYRIVGTPLEPAFQNSWYGGVQFGKDRAGNTILRGDFANGSSPSLGSVICTLPPGYQPSDNGTIATVAVASWNSDLSAQSYASLYCDASGNVTYGTGDASTAIVGQGYWFADGLGS